MVQLPDKIGRQNIGSWIMTYM